MAASNSKKKRPHVRYEATEFRTRAKMFGMDPDDLENMIHAQDGICPICEEQSENPYSLHVDHDHMDGQVRGLLCFICNTRLEWLLNVGLEKVLEYLGKEADDIMLPQQLR